ncbi:hypothetical protein SFUMM280S_10745 [Streptomyces fumanus]
MGDGQTWAAAPAAAERARSVLAAAWSCAVTSEAGREEFTGAHSVTGDGRVLLRVPEDSALPAAAICAPRGEPSAVLEFADVAPVPVRSRIRARLWLAGRLTAGEGHLVFHPTRLVLRQSAGAVVVDREEFAAAAPDPLATAEAHLLTHLADRHGDAVERLTRLVDPASLHGAVRVRPLRRRPARTDAAHRTGPRPRRRTPAVPPPRRRPRPAHRAGPRPARPGGRRALPPRPAPAAHRPRRLTRTPPAPKEGGYHSPSSTGRPAASPRGSTWPGAGICHGSCSSPSQSPTGATPSGPAGARSAASS